VSGAPLLARRAVWAVARRPDLWATAARIATTMATPGWWRRWPPVPSVPADYERFRRQTMFGGDGEGRLDAAALVAYLAWCREMRRPAR
jgi:hypothetical protein